MGEVYLTYFILKQIWNARQLSDNVKAVVSTSTYISPQSRSNQGKKTPLPLLPLWCVSLPCVLTEARENIPLRQIHHDVKCILSTSNWRKPLPLWKYVTWLQSLENEYSDTCNVTQYNQRYCHIVLNHFLLLKINFLFKSLILIET